MKELLRTKKLTERIAHHPQLQSKKSAQILKKLRANSAFKKAHKILFYLPIHGEVNLSALLSTKNKVFVLPKVKGNTLQLHVIKNISHTKKGKFDILEPLATLPKIKPQELDLVLAAGVAFDKNGNRIGYGKGFYDRLLPKTRCPKIGIAYDFQIVNNIPGQAHDIPMDMVITEKRSLKARRKKITA